MNKILTFFAVLVLASAGGCGYKTGSTVLEGYKTIAIPVFRNETFQENVEVYITNSVIKEFQLDGSLEVTNKDKANLFLIGKIISWKRVGGRSTGDDFRTVTEYLFELAVVFDLWDQEEREYIFRDVKIKAENGYFLETDLPAAKKRSIPLEREQNAVISSSDIYETERSAMWRAADRVSKKILQKVVERW